MLGHSRIAQLVEQLTVNQRVVGSSPTPGELPRNPKLRRAWDSLCFKAFLDSTQPCVGVGCSTTGPIREFQRPADLTRGLSQFTDRTGFFVTNDLFIKSGLLPKTDDASHALPEFQR